MADSDVAPGIWLSSWTFSEYLEGSCLLDLVCLCNTRAVSLGTGISCCC